MYRHRVKLQSPISQLGELRYVAKQEVDLTIVEAPVVLCQPPLSIPPVTTSRHPLMVPQQSTISPRFLVKALLRHVQNQQHAFTWFSMNNSSACNWSWNSIAQDSHLAHKVSGIKPQVPMIYRNMQCITMPTDRVDKESSFPWSSPVAFLLNDHCYPYLAMDWRWWGIENGFTKGWLWIMNDGK